MEDMENYTSLQEFTEDTCPRGNRLILHTKKMQDTKLRVESVRSWATLILLAPLLVSICANIALGVLLYKSTCPSQSDPLQESAELTARYQTLSKRYSKLCEDYSSVAAGCASTVTVQACKPCPDSWIEFEGKCYYFNNNKLDWAGSKASCESMDSHLVILRSHKQHAALEVEARRLGGFDYHFWIGLSDTDKEGDWKWVDNTPVNTTYWDDNHSEPDNHQTGGLHGEDCAVLNSHSRSWFDVPCDFLYKHICEMNALSIS